jgi:hypothetical protein
MVVKNLTVEGEPSKRYRIIYWGTIVGHWDKAKDALEHYYEHSTLIRPQIDKHPKAKKHKPRYKFLDGQKEIALAALKGAAQAEEP